MKKMLSVVLSIGLLLVSSGAVCEGTRESINSDGYEVLFDHEYLHDIEIVISQEEWGGLIQDMKDYAEEFAGSLQAMGRATIIGSQTPGSCLTANVAPLPQGAVLLYPFGQPQTTDGRVLEGNGVVPDIVVELDRQELGQGVDGQLEAAVTYLEEDVSAQ